MLVVYCLGIILLIAYKEVIRNKTHILGVSGSLEPVNQIIIQVPFKHKEEGIWEMEIWFFKNLF